MYTEKDQLVVNTLRALSIDQIEAANSGHPGLPLGVAPMAYVLWGDHLNLSHQAMDWINRDRFVLSPGHGSALLYSLLHLSGLSLTNEDLRKFRQLNSLTPGHPEYGHTAGVEATTGPLGQGVAQAVGMAMAEAHTAAIFNTEEYPIIDHYTYAVVSDGDLMEGISYEACSFAGRQALGKLIFLYDSNDISLDGDLNQAFTEDIRKRFEAQNWHYQRVEDGNDLEAIHQAIEAAKSVTDQPSIIEVKTIIGFGSPDQGTAKVHGAPLGADNWTATKSVYQYTYEAFETEAEAGKLFEDKIRQRGQAAYEAWKVLYHNYQKDQPEKAAMLELAMTQALPENYAQGLSLVDADQKADATRSSSGKAIQALSETIPYFWGGSADLSGSNKTMIKGGEDFMPANRAGRNIWFGVREFAMAAMMNGAALHGLNRIYGGTFFVFSDYLKAAVRLSALSQLPVTYVLTHDSIAVGEDGPTHQPIEQLAAFRAMPNVNVIRPADVNETFIAWQVALESKNRPSLLVLSRQNLPVLAETKILAAEGLRRGAYVISPSAEDCQGILIATGSEVQLALEAQEILKGKGHHVSVVSMPSQNIFDEQTEDYKESVLPKSIRNRMSIEMSSSYGWAIYTGLDGLTYSIDRFGASGPGDEVVAAFKYTAEEIAKAYMEHFTK